MICAQDNVQGDSSTIKAPDCEVSIGDIKSKYTLTQLKNPDWKIKIVSFLLMWILIQLETNLELVLNNIDVLVVEETKLDETFPGGCFDIPGYERPVRREHSGAGIVLFIKEDIPSCKSNVFNFSIYIEGSFILTVWFYLGLACNKSL